MTDQFIYPNFKKLTPQSYIESFDLYSEEYKRVLEQQIAKADYDYEAFFAPLEKIDLKFALEVSPIHQMMSVINTPELREVHDKLLPKFVEFSLYLEQHQGLFEATKKILEQGKAQNKLNPEQIKSLENTLLDFELSGIGLQGKDKEEYSKLSLELAQVATKFSNNLIDSVNSYELIITDFEKIKNLPESAINLAKQSAQTKGIEGWRFTLDAPSALPFIGYVEDRDLRKQLFLELSHKASELSSFPQFDNRNQVAEILRLKLAKAKLLGFSSIAEISLQRKMAKSSDEVRGFLAKIKEKALPKAKVEAQRLRDLAKADGVELQAWDVAYYSNKLQKKEYDFDSESLRPYFPETRVVQGLFDIIKKVFAISFKERKVDDLFHPDAKLYELHDEKGNLIAGIIFDLYMREGKRGGAWVNNCIDRHADNNGVRLPITYLTCNFNPPVGDTPALFSHDEVLTLFHEMGHALHNTLTKVGVSSVAGFNGVEWDAVELPSQFMENFTWSEEGVKLLSQHYKTKESVPKELLDKLIANKNFNSGLFLVRQIENGTLDIEVHTEYSEQNIIDANQLFEQVRGNLSQQVFQFTDIVPARFANSFSHIFNEGFGGYTAGYYSYLWAEVLSADAFESFEQQGVFSAKEGLKFRTYILEAGSVKPALENYINFKGKAPSVEPLLKSYGVL